ncbi:hypothetical protein H0H87_004781 [Tephrocybe sp. NHM501043]|nr:hypothetical protein H0H87_004781 [Tephrocybe sp. NHM501043]
MVNMKSATENRKPYSGLTRSLVIAVDVGTTFSGVSYAILEPGEIPKIHGVTRFPGQEHVAGNSKIPSIIYYDKHGKIMAAGAEADTSSVVAQAEDEGWIKTDLFKLRLRPRTMQLNMNGMRLGPLPRRKTAVHVLGDWLAYLYRCTRNFITDTHGNGAALWNAVENNVQFVLSHPNGWEGAQQTKMRRSAVYGGLIPDTNEGKARIRFVTEGEASLHACVLNGLAADVLSNPSKHGFLIADAGGGTLDISSYAIRGTTPLVMEEIAPPDCKLTSFHGVTSSISSVVEKLRDSKYGTPAALDHITQRFDETTKRLFRDRKDLQFIPFGSPLDKDLAVGIRGGQLKLTGNEVANLFEPSVDAAVSAIKAQIEASNGIIKSVFLVGGYAASPWLFNQLQERLAPLSITVSRPDTQTSKAVADGAIGFYCDHHVSARMSKFMYGVEFLRELDPTNPDHVARKERLCELPSGPKLLPDAFDCILNRSVRVKESTVFTRKYCTELTSLSMLSVFEVEIWCYRGGNVVPKWINRQADDFSTLCVVRADLSPLSGSAEPKAGRNGKTYWTIVFSVEIHFGLTEFKARIKWVDDNKIVSPTPLPTVQPISNSLTSGPASIIYNERGHRADEDEPDAYPEDDVGTASPRDRLRSEPASRARTPIEQFYHPSMSGGDTGFEPPLPEPQPPAEIPSVHRTPSSHRSPSIHAGLDSSRDLSRSVEHERIIEPPVQRERTPSLAPSILAPSISAPPPDLPQPEVVVEVVETKSPKDRKGKGKEKTPTTTPKAVETLSPVVEPPPAKSPVTTPKAEVTLPPAVEPTPAAKTPELTENLSSSLWATDPTPAPETSSTFGWGTSPSVKSKGTPKAPEVAITVESKRSSIGWGSSPSAKEKENESTIVTDPIALKTSPAIGTSKSPLATTEPIVAADVETPAPASVSPAPVLTGKAAKKAKKKAASAAATPAVEAVEPPKVDAAEPAPAESAKEDPTPTTIEEPTPVSTEKPVSSSLTPIGLPEVTLSTKTPEPGSLTIGDDIQGTASSLFGSDVWGSTDVKTSQTDSFDTWGSFSASKTPKSRPKTPLAKEPKAEEPKAEEPKAEEPKAEEPKAEEPKAEEPKTEEPKAEEPKTEEPKAKESKTEDPPAETPAAVPETKSTFGGWGAAKKTPTDAPKTTTSLGWGTPATKKAGWGATSTPASTTPGWDASFGSAKTPTAKSSPWGTKANTPTTTKAPSSPWGAKPSTPVESKEETKEEAKPADEPAPAETTTQAPETEVMKTDETTHPAATDAPEEASKAADSTEGLTKGATPKPDEAELKAETPKAAAEEVKQPTPQPSPKPVEVPLEPTTEPETPVDVVSPTAEENEENEDKEEDDKKKTTTKKAGGGGGGGGKKKKKKK